MSSNLQPTADYSSVAEWYDNTRHMPSDLVEECFSRFAATVDFAPPKHVLDAGCGTAQLSLPLMDAGHRVVGLDVSEAMLARARAKLQPQWRARFVVGDVREMDFPDAHFDATVVSKLFQHVPGWQRAVDEIRRVTKPGGYLLHINEKGAFQNAVRRRFAEECDRRGHFDRYHGLRDRAQLASYVQQIGGHPLVLDVRGLNWEKDITYGEASEHLGRKLHSEFWSIPDDEYAAILDTVAGWIADQPHGIASVERVTPHITAEVFRWDCPAGR